MIMKRSALTITVLLFCAFTVYGQLFPTVKKPASETMSLLALQLSHDNNGSMTKIVNTNFSGWAPAVKGPDGLIVPFRRFDAGADFTNIFYAENLIAGEYTLIGFYHVYTDYGKLKQYETEIGRTIITSYEPYEDRSYQVKQLFPLKNNVIVNLEAGKVKTFGSYAIKFGWVGGAMGTTDDRWKMNEEKTLVTVEDPSNELVLRYMKSWATPAWKKWNELNPASKL